MLGRRSTDCVCAKNSGRRERSKLIFPLEKVGWIGSFHPTRKLKSLFTEHNSYRWIEPYDFHRLSKAEGIAFSSVFIEACFFIVAGNFPTINCTVWIKQETSLEKSSLGYEQGGFWSIAGSSIFAYVPSGKRGLLQTGGSQNQTAITSFSLTFLSTSFSRKYRLFLLSQSHWRGFTPSIGLIDTEHCPCDRIRLVFFSPGHSLSLPLRSSPYYFG